ncbi:MAG: stage III sporulation protein AG [Eubacteriales bacterium]|nr:stage III sporulation protein AG [Eubacteriales bacterium]
MNFSKLRTWCKKRMTRENMIVLGLLGILIMVIALPTEKKEKANTESGLLDSGNDMMDSDTGQGDFLQEEALEKRLEAFLACMDGVGEVRVMITFASTQEQVVEKDSPASRSQTNESDSAGGSRSVVSEDLEEDTVYTTDQAGNQVPYVKQTLAARVEGVTVLAQGGDSGTVQKNITDVIEALFGIEAHKIKVAKMVTAP